MKKKQSFGFCISSKGPSKDNGGICDYDRRSENASLNVFLLVSNSLWKNLYTNKKYARWELTQKDDNGDWK